MIKLSIEKYCSDCMGFEPEAEMGQAYTNMDGKRLATDTVVYCRYRQRCAIIKQYLEAENKCKTVKR